MMKNRKFNAIKFKRSMLKIAGIAFIILFLFKVVAPIMANAPISPESAVHQVQYDGLEAADNVKPIAVTVKGFDNLVYVVKMSDDSFRIVYMDNVGEDPYHAREINDSVEDQKKYGDAMNALSK